MSNDTLHTFSSTYKCDSSVAVSYFIISILFALTLCMPMRYANAQQSQAEHESHHPGNQPGIQQNQTNSTIIEVPNTAGKGMGGGGMGGGGMEKMMEKMGAPKPKDLYPSLMALPDLPQEQRDELKRTAHKRMLQGTSTMSGGFRNLSAATDREDYAGMQEAVEQVKEGIGEYNSGLATHRALEEGKAPKNVAMQWFKSQMNLLPVSMQKQSTAFLGMSPFHTSVMIILILFAAAMIWMYFFKMHRASTLLQELAKRPSKKMTLDTTDTDEEAVPASAASPAPIQTPAAGEKFKGKLKIIGLFQETHDVKTFRLANLAGGSLPFSYKPGQFVTFMLQPENKIVKRSYTIASSPSQKDYMEVTIKREDQGLISRYMHDKVKLHDQLDLLAPAGKFYFNGSEADNIVLISGGVGITPMMSATRYLTAHCWPGNIYFLFCARTSNDFIFRHELENLQQRHANLHVLASMTRAEGTAWMGPKGQFTAEIISDFVPNISQHRAHICGPPPMMDAIKNMLLELSVPETLIKTEAFGTIKRAPTTTPATTPVSTDQPLPKVTFSLSQKTAALPPDKTVLEAAEDSDVDIDNSCRSGTCGSCKVKLLSGRVSMEVDDALEPDEKDQGYILACQAIATEDVAVEA